jgi:RNA-directed DNA polymerase
MDSDQRVASIKHWTRSRWDWCHEWMMRFIQHRVADPRILHLIQKWLKAGVLEEGKRSETKVGTPQGAVISPLLANIYLHYVYDQWVEAWRKKLAKGDVIVVRYADDTVMGFQYRADADRFLEELRERMRKFGLELHPEKTRRIEFGRYAGRDRKRRGAGKPETFDFLGFTHIGGTNGTHGAFVVWRKSASKRMRAKLQQIKQQLHRRRHEPPAQTGKWLQSVVQGYFNYHAVPGNSFSLARFRNRVIRHWRSSLRRRSDRHRLSWSRFGRLAEKWLPVQHILSVSTSSL